MKVPASFCSACVAANPDQRRAGLSLPVCPSRHARYRPRPGDRLRDWHARAGGVPALAAFAVRLVFSPAAARRDVLDILKVGAIACLSPLQSVLTVLILTGLIARFGTNALAGYGIGVRLEFLLIPITFAIGIACVPLVGMAIGAGDVERARRIAWTGGAMAALIMGAIGFVAAAMPWLWANIFTSDPGVLASAYSYLAGLVRLRFSAGPVPVFRVTRRRQSAGAGSCRHRQAARRSGGRMVAGRPRHGGMVDLRADRSCDDRFRADDGGGYLLRSMGQSGSCGDAEARGAIAAGRSRAGRSADD